MSRYRYDDVKVTFEATDDPHSFRALAIDLATGADADGTFHPPLTDEELIGIARAGVGASRDVSAGTEAVTAATAADVGRRLAEALFAGPIGSLYTAATERLAAEPERGVRLALSLGRAPALLKVPWELLYVHPRFLASQQRTPVVRLIESATVRGTATIDGALRILGIVSSPRDLAPLDVGAERRLVDEATAAARERGTVTLDWLEPATPASLRTALRDRQYHVVHFVGHSDLTADGGGVIFLEREDGSARPFDETLLANLVADQSATLRLVVLNSCKAARSSADDPQAGVAATLMALGLPAVVAMQFAISDRAAITFAGELYTNLVAEQPIDTAVGEARKAILADVSETEWATPVLFLRDLATPLFTFATTASDPPEDRAPAPATVSVTGSGPVAIGGNITISGTTVAGRDLVRPDHEGGAP